METINIKRVWEIFSIFEKVEENKRESEEYEEERKKSLLREIKSCKSILERDFGMKFE